MKPFDHDLQRLINAAVRAEGKSRGSPSFALEARILNGWRLGSGEEPIALLLPLFRRAAVVAAVVMVGTLTFNYLLLSLNEPNALALAERAVQLSLLP
jgi:hypothetical protein